MKKKIGVFGGSFDPIHYGHLVLAENAREGVGLEEVFFMPTFIQPFKMEKEVAKSDHRLEMLNIAIEDNDCFKVTTTELDHGEVSYTVNSLERLKDEFGDGVEIHFIMGTDSFLNLEKWHRADDLLTTFSFIVGERPRYKNAEVKQHIEYLNNKYGTMTHKIENIKIDISSSDIKERLLEDRSIRYLLPSRVLEYIYGNGLYKAAK